jgi:hypothetical protein
MMLCHCLSGGLGLLPLHLCNLQGCPSLSAVVSVGACNSLAMHLTWLNSKVARRRGDECHVPALTVHASCAWLVLCVPAVLGSLARVQGSLRMAAAVVTRE